MSKKFVYTLEQKSKFNVDQNFLQFYPNFPFTNPQLRQKRIISLLLKKLILNPENDRLTVIILAYLLSLLKRENNACEEQLLDMIESLILKYSNGKDHFKKVIDSIVDEHKRTIKNVKKVQKQGELIRWYSALIKYESYEEVYHSLLNRIDQNLSEGSHTVLVFLMAKLIKNNNFEILDKSFVTTRMRTFNSKEVYLINEYSKYLEEKLEYQEALEFLATFNFSKVDDNLALKKTYLRILLKTKASAIVTEALETLKKDPFDELHSHILFDCLKFLVKDDDQDIEPVIQVLFEILAVNRKKGWIWQKFAEFLMAFRNNDRFDQYFAADKIGEFVKLHFDKVQLLNDAKEYIVMRKQAANRKIEHYGDNTGQHNVMEAKVQVIKSLDNPDKAIQEYINAFRKINQSM